MDLAKSVRAKRIIIKNNSQVVKGQSMGEFEATEELMKKYQEEVQKWMMHFDEVTI